MNSSFQASVVAFVITLAAVAAGPEPERTGLNAERVTLSDRAVQVVCDGSPVVRVLDEGSRVQAGTFDLGSGCAALSVCDDGSVVVLEDGSEFARRLRLDSAGSLHDTGEQVAYDSGAVASRMVSTNASSRSSAADSSRNWRPQTVATIGSSRPG